MRTLMIEADLTLTIEVPDEHEDMTLDELFVYAEQYLSERVTIMYSRDDIDEPTLVLDDVYFVNNN